MISIPSYSVAIRTLGTAGSKYQETLDSIARQTIKPDAVFVYIPWSYELPKETIGIEEYVRCDKGMVTQRSLPFNEISSEFILFLDDDLSFEKDFVEHLFTDLIKMGGDCICPDIYYVHEKSLAKRALYFFGGTWPHFMREWSFRIRLDGHYSYNSSPHNSDVLLSQSGAGACILCKKEAYEAIHFADERWMDQFHFGLGEDQLFLFKLYKYGFKLLTSYNARIIHLDAGTGHERDKSDEYRASGFCRYMIWYRTIFSEKKELLWKIRCSMAFAVSCFLFVLLCLALIIKYRSISPLCAYFEGIKIAKKFIHSQDYLRIPSYYEYVLK